MANSFEERLSRLKQFLSSEQANANPSKLYIMDLRECIDGCEVEIARLKLAEGRYYQMVTPAELKAGVYQLG